MKCPLNGYWQFQGFGTRSPHFITGEMNRSLHVRLGKESDFAFVEKSLCELMKTCIFTEKVPKIRNFANAFKYCVEHPKHSPIFIAEEDGVRMGCAACNVIESFTHGKSLSIADLVVDSTIRAKGIGSALMKGIKEYAKENDIHSIELFTPKEKAENTKERQNFYKKNGFQQIGPALLFEFNPNSFILLE